MHLALRIHLRSHSKAEDLGYAETPEHWTQRASLKSFTHAFMFQGLFLLFAYPIIMVKATAKPGVTFFDLIGLLLGMFGFLFEMFADS